MTLQVRTAISTDIGRFYQRNEDAWAQLPTQDGGLLLAVCDGMGGMGRGDEASHLAIAELTQRLGAGAGFPPERMAAALRATDVALRQTLCTTGEGLPGSTAVLVYILGGLAHVCWAGDSRAYHIRGSRVLERTTDHKLVQELLALGELSEEEAQRSSLSNVITRALGGRLPADPALEPECLDHPWDLEPGDFLLLCSDGLVDLVRDEELPFFFDGQEPTEIADALVQTALARGGHDNITVIVCQWTGDPEEELPAPLTSKLPPPPERPDAPPGQLGGRRLALLAVAIALVLGAAGFVAASSLLDGVLAHRPAAEGLP